MVLIDEIKYLLEDLNISDWAFCNYKLFGIEVDIFSALDETASLSALSFDVSFDAFTVSEAFTVTFSEFTEWSAHFLYIVK